MVVSGHTQAGSIDLVVGRMADQPKEGVFVDPNFEIDAARINISQKTDVDKNFNLPNGSVRASKCKKRSFFKGRWNKIDCT